MSGSGRTLITAVAAAALGAAMLTGPALTGLPVAAADAANPGSPFDVTDPAVGQLEPRLLGALQQAATAAAAEGITVSVTSGWRSPGFQQQLLDDAIIQYGSYPAARQWVQTPEQSKHVLGQAVDVGGTGVYSWMAVNGPRFGLCQIYANEPWHFELAADAFGNCPALLPTAAG